MSRSRSQRRPSRPPASALPPHQPAPGSLSPDLLGRALLPLRAFLGFTFCFAGLQKLANPGFFQAGNPGSIQAQLAGAARRSPIHTLISPLTHLAVPLGLLIAVAELAIGLGTLLGLWQRLAAAGGVALSLMLFLTVSFHASPYYTGADIVFAFAWTPLLLAGSGPLLSADAAIAARARRGSRRMSAEEASRREVVLKGTVTAAAAVAGLILGGMAAGLGLAGWRHKARLRHRAVVPGPVGVRAEHGTRFQRSRRGWRQSSGWDRDRTRQGCPGRRRRVVHRSPHRRPLDRDPGHGRQVRGLRRGVPACRLHGRIRPVRRSHHLPVSRLAVQRRHRRSRSWPCRRRPKPHHDR